MECDVVSGLAVSLNATIYDAAVSGGGVLVSTVVSDYGQDDIESGSEAIGTMCLAGGTEYVVSGGVTIDAQVVRAGRRDQRRRHHRGDRASERHDAHDGLAGLRATAMRTYRICDHQSWCAD